MMPFSVALTLRFRNWARHIANESFTSGSSSYVDFGLPGTGKQTQSPRATFGWFFQREPRRM